MDDLVVIEIWYQAASPESAAYCNYYQILYRNTVEVPDSLDFPFAKVESTMRLLYNYAEGVSFEVF